MILPLLLACGSSDPLPQPNPPPAPPPALAMADPDLLTVTGQVSEVHAATRSWVVVGDGQRTIAVLGETAVLEIDGRAALVGDLAAGATVTATGRQTGDVLVVQRATTGAAPDAAPAGTPQVVDPAAPADVAAPAAPPAGAPTEPRSPVDPATPPPATPPPAAPPG